MKVFLAGGSGAIGKRLIPMLVAAGHEVVATTRTPAKTNRLRALGARPFALDALNRTAVIEAVASAEPDVVVHELTALSAMGNLKRFDEEFEITNRLRTEGTQYLLEAAQAANVPRVVAQSYTGFPNIREGGRIKTEDDPLDPNPPESMRRTFAAMMELSHIGHG